MGRVGTALPVGPVDTATSGGATVRTNVEFAFAKDAAFIIVEQDGYARSATKTCRST